MPGEVAQLSSYEIVLEYRYNAGIYYCCTRGDVSRTKRYNSQISWKTGVEYRSSDRQHTEEESQLGYATSEEVDAFAESHGVSKKTATRTWRGLARWEGAIGRLNKGKGLGLFDEFSSSLNLDCLEFVLASGLTAAIPNFGSKMEQFSQNFIDSRRQQLETQETGGKRLRE